MTAVKFDQKMFSKSAVQDRIRARGMDAWKKRFIESGIDNRGTAGKPMKNPERLNTFRIDRVWSTMNANLAGVGTCEAGHTTQVLQPTTEDEALKVGKRFPCERCNEMQATLRVTHFEPTHRYDMDVFVSEVADRRRLYAETGDESFRDYSDLFETYTNVVEKDREDQ